MSDVEGMDMFLEEGHQQVSGEERDARAGPGPCCVMRSCASTPSCVEKHQHRLTFKASLEKYASVTLTWNWTRAGMRVVGLLMADH